MCCFSIKNILFICVVHYYPNSQLFGDNHISILSLTTGGFWHQRVPLDLIKKIWALHMTWPQKSSLVSNQMIWKPVHISLWLFYAFRWQISHRACYVSCFGLPSLWFYFLCCVWLKHAVGILCPHPELTYPSTYSHSAKLKIYTECLRSVNKQTKKKHPLPTTVYKKFKKSQKAPKEMQWEKSLSCQR